MTHTYRIKAIIGWLTILIILITPMFGVIYSICKHAWGLMVLAIGAQIIVFFIMLILFVVAYGFIDKGPGYDFVEAFLSEINYFYKRGYEIKTLFGSGSCHPGVKLVKAGLPEITLVLNYHPITNSNSTTLIFSQFGRDKQYRYDCKPDMRKFAKEFDSWFGEEDNSLESLRLKDFIPYKGYRRGFRRIPLPPHRSLRLYMQPIPPCMALQLYKKQ